MNSMKPEENTEITEEGSAGQNHSRRSWIIAGSVVIAIDRNPESEPVKTIGLNNRIIIGTIPPADWNNPTLGMEI